MSERKLAAIILAAGEASRFGSPKQVLVWEGQPLVERTVRSAIDAGCKQVVVVTGAHQEAVAVALQPFADSPIVSLSQNSNWEQGMHTSISCGLQAILNGANDIEAVLVLTVDQPLIDAEFLRKLIEAQKGFDAAALAYPSGAGVPSCFGESLFDKLLHLETSGVGAKNILRDSALNIRLLDAPKRRLDIDTLADWDDFTKT